VLGQNLSGFLNNVSGQLGTMPVNRNAGSTHGAHGSIRDFRADSISGYQRNGVGHDQIIDAVAK
jgi:hypothetical protein